MNAEEVISSSPFFNTVWYEKTYCKYKNPVQHYLEDGWRLGYDPSEYFSTCDYLGLYPDVADADINPLLHYELYGRKEGRACRLRDYRISPSDRFRLITGRCNLRGKGLEIGPSFNPICPKKKGYNIEIMDHLDQEGLRKKYEHDPNVQGLIQQIETVDYVWNGEDYRTLIGKENYYDYILASHLIEHTTDFIGFFEQCTALLKEGGVLSLVIPDKRYCFDFFRENSSLSQVIEKYWRREYKHPSESVIEYSSHVVALNHMIAWSQEILEVHKNFAFLHMKEDIQRLLERKDYVDIHEWVFTPTSFRILINDLQELGFIKDLYELSFSSSAKNTCEFYISLEKKCRKDQTKLPFNQERRMMLYQHRIREEKDFYDRF